MTLQAIHKMSILNVHQILLLIPFKTGMVPIQWRKTVQIMLEKEPGAPWIHRLRIIELFDAQANAGFQIFVGRNMMRHAVSNDLLQAESLSIGTFLARLMFQAKRHVRTGYGISVHNIRTTNTTVLHGIGQGNDRGPVMWISHLTVMFAALSSVYMGFALTCVQNILHVATVGTGYVNDVTLGLAIPHEQPQTESMVYKQMKQMGQLWENLLFITGGRLELSKCFWIPITWQWNGRKPTLVLKKLAGKT